MASRLRHRHTDEHGDNDEGLPYYVDSEAKEHKSHGVYHGSSLSPTVWFSRAIAWFRSIWQKLSRKQLRANWRNVVGAILSILLMVALIIFLAGGPPPASSLVRPSYPIPPVPPNVLASVVIMNHNRPRMLKESALIPTLLEHPHVGEILLCHSNPKTRFNHTHPKVRNIDAVQANRDKGLALRFHFAATQASHPWVIHVDDDQEMSLMAISELLGEFSRNTHRIVGRYGRTYNFFWNQQRHGYNTRTILGPVEVVLTKFMVMETRLCRFFAQYEQIVSEMIPESKPKWNGEDIFMNLVSNHVYGVPPNGPYHNFAFRMDVWEASDALKDDDTGQHDISGNMDRHRLWNVGWSAYWEASRKAQLHTAYRGRLWDLAKRELAKLPRPTLEEWSLPPAREFSVE